jgi:hypothetical protein
MVVPGSQCRAAICTARRSPPPSACNDITSERLVALRSGQQERADQRGVRREQLIKLGQQRAWTGAHATGRGNDLAVGRLRSRAGRARAHSTATPKGYLPPGRIDQDVAAPDLADPALLNAQDHTPSAELLVPAALIVGADGGLISVFYPARAS